MLLFHPPAPLASALWVVHSTLTRSRAEERGQVELAATAHAATSPCDAQYTVEIDGPSHDGRQRRDRLRDTFFRRRGILVLRFTNDEALFQTESVLERIRIVLRRISPSHSEGGRGGELAATPVPRGMTPTSSAAC